MFDFTYRPINHAIDEADEQQRVKCNSLESKIIKQIKKLNERNANIFGKKLTSPDIVYTRGVVL